MDALAKDHWRNTTSQGPTIQPEVAGSPWTLRMQGQSVHCDVRQTVHHHISGRQLCSHWGHRQRFAPGSSADVDWDAAGDLMDHLPRARQHWPVKQASGTSAIGKNLQRRGRQASAHCPRCNFPVEDCEHVLRCPHPEVAKLWKSWLQGFDLWLLGQKTDPELRSAMVAGLHNWCFVETPKLVELDGRGKKVCDAQTTIGWRSLLEGCPAFGWKSTQDEWFQRQGFKTSGRRWLRRVLTRIPDFSFRLWEHRNGVAHDNDTSLLSQEVNAAVDLEFNTGFRGFVGKHRLRASREVVKSGNLVQRQAWLRKVQTMRRALARQQEKRTAPSWVCDAIGCVDWMQTCERTAAPTEEMIAQFPQLRTWASTGTANQH